MINRLKFFDVVRVILFGGKLKSGQVAGLESILGHWESNGGIQLTDTRWLAYMLATVYHETARTMKAIEEYGKGKGKPYGKKIKYSGKSYKIPNKLFYGRGKVQLTWYENYEHMGRLLGYDLVSYPEDVLKDDVSNKILFEGMTRGYSSFGDFTGRSLEMYFNEIVNDPINARRIINGLDKAKLIASYHNKFLEALS